MPGPAHQAPVLVTMGDPNGIGPEVIVKAWQSLRHTGPTFCVLGDAVAFPTLEKVRIDDTRQANQAFTNALPILTGFTAHALTPGHPQAAQAPVIVSCIEQGVALTLRGAGRALVTAPIAKSVLMESGFKHPGHTEFLGALLAEVSWAGPRGPVMMLAIEGLRVVPVTIHCPLREVADRLTTRAIVDAGRVTAASLQTDFGIPEPRLAVAALNPHAGEDGTFGDEEARLIAPAIAALRAEGLNVSGPHPADSLFHAGARARYDAVICMYHDQALIPLKALDFWGGVNITCGLPIIRTSPDHGTGFDIAGRDMANPESMIAAIKLADALASRRGAARPQDTTT